MMRFAFGLVLLLTLAACASPATPSSLLPTLAPKPVVLPTSAPTETGVASSAAPAQVACNATYQVPGNQFRADNPAKLDTGSKPKLVEFFAFW